MTVFMRRFNITDAGLLLFVRWCRRNPEHIVFDPVTARQFLYAYAGRAPAIDPGVGLAERLALVDEAAE